MSSYLLIQRLSKKNYEKILNLAVSISEKILTIVFIKSFDKVFQNYCFIPSTKKKYMCLRKGFGIIRYEHIFFTDLVLHSKKTQKLRVSFTESYRKICVNDFP